MHETYIICVCSGVTLCLKTVASCMQCPVYGIQRVAAAPLSSVEALAGFYLQVSRLYKFFILFFLYKVCSESSKSMMSGLESIKAMKTVFLDA